MKCKVEDREAPHALEDIGFEWGYYEDGGEDGQGAVGLGGLFSAGVEDGEERRSSGERGRKEQREEEDSVDEGIGGF